MEELGYDGAREIERALHGEKPRRARERSSATGDDRHAFSLSGVPLYTHGSPEFTVFLD
jgi:hypothetical protein